MSSSSSSSRLQTLLSQPTTKPIVQDGGLGTTLRDTFHKDCSGAVWGSRLLAEDPDVIYQAHKAFLECGSDIILTGTYQSSVDGFLSLGYTSEQAEKFMRLAIELAVKARDDYIKTSAFKDSGRPVPVVGLSLGSYGAMLCGGEEYNGLFPPSCDTAFLTSFHLSRLQVFAPLLSTIDFIAFETIPLAIEITAIRQAVSLLDGSSKDLPFWIGIACPSGNWADKGQGGLGGVGRKAFWDEGKVEGGEELRRPFGVALNCTDLTSLAALISSLSPPTPLPTGPPSLVLYPNHNVRFLDSSDYWHNFPDSERLTAKQWVDQLIAITQGAEEEVWAKRAIIGGCCGTALEEIAELRKGVDAL